MTAPQVSSPTPARGRRRAGGALRATARHLVDLLPSAADYAGARRTWRRDLVAGVTVGIVALPLALGFGVSSGLSPAAGLITAIVAGLIAAVFGGSHVQVSGPTGAMVVVLVPIVATHGAGAVALVSVMAGVLVLLAGILRLGRAVSFIPWPVIEGFTLGIAAIIFLQQIPSLTGADDTAELSSNALVAAVQSLLGADPRYLLWAIGAVAVVVACMVLAPRIHPALPGSLLGVVCVTVLTALVPTPLEVIGALPSTLPAPTIPPFSPDLLLDLAPAAATVAALAAIESLLSARVAASLADTGPYNPDRELLGQGLASVGSGLFGGMPATGAIARTAVNVRSGGRTRIAAVTHAVVLLLIVLALARPVGLIPLAGLAGVLMVTAWNMVHRATVRSILRSTRGDAITFVITALVTVSFDLIVAVGIGIVIAGIAAIRSLSRTAMVHRQEVSPPREAGDDRIAIIAFAGPLMFASADRVFEEVTRVEGVEVVILRLSTLEHLDATGAHILSDIVQALERRGITVLIKGVQPVHDSLLREVGVLAALRHTNHLFDDLDAAIAHARSHVARSERTAG
ncbi:SulP family inorganic anion transporter [Serinibacter salmoneus]|uniref:SulP family sulfate permease n=1 Tax=Serinibacter salmoneus TaxID=556530 RepID=A0A2A9D089_9MICO|nr:SulP family inorganic anion transporter [Serinibacter salmoneus]PFG20084.1 SulP family sulfate permease [Serinibacter salmoneus]